FNTDFTRRGDASAHRTARPADAVPRRPRPEQQIPAGQLPQAQGESGFPLQQAGPGEFAAYQRRGSAPAVAADEHVPSDQESDGLSLAEQARDDEGIDERTIAGQPVRPPSASAAESSGISAERTAAVPFDEFQESVSEPNSATEITAGTVDDGA